MTMKASQLIKLYNRMCYLPINFGDKLTVFVESFESAGATKRATNYYLMKSLEYVGWRGRLSGKAVALDFFFDHYWKILLCIVLWVLRVVEFVLCHKQVTIP